MHIYVTFDLDDVRKTSIFLFTKYWPAQANSLLRKYTLVLQQEENITKDKRTKDNF